MEKKNLGQSLEAIACYSEGLTRLTRDLKKDLTDPETGEAVKVDFTRVRGLINSGLNNLDRTLIDCTGDGVKDDLKRVLENAPITVALALRIIFEILDIEL
jgi:hypothetical protein